VNLVPVPETAEGFEATQAPEEVGGTVAESKETGESGHTAVATEGEVTKEGEVAASSEAAEGSKISQIPEEFKGTVAESKETDEREHTIVVTGGEVTKEGDAGASSESFEALEVTHPPELIGGTTESEVTEVSVAETGSEVSKKHNVGSSSKVAESGRFTHFPVEIGGSAAKTVETETPSYTEIFASTESEENLKLITVKISEVTLPHIISKDKTVVDIHNPRTTELLKKYTIYIENIASETPKEIQFTPKITLPLNGLQPPVVLTTIKSESNVKFSTSLNANTAEVSQTRITNEETGSTKTATVEEQTRHISGTEIKEEFDENEMEHFSQRGSTLCEPCGEKSSSPEHILGDASTHSMELGTETTKAGTVASEEDQIKYEGVTEGLIQEFEESEMPHFSQTGGSTLCESCDVTGTEKRQTSTAEVEQIPHETEATLNENEASTHQEKLAEFKGEKEETTIYSGTAAPEEEQIKYEEVTEGLIQEIEESEMPHFSQTGGSTLCESCDVTGTEKPQTATAEVEQIPHETDATLNENEASTHQAKLAEFKGEKEETTIYSVVTVPNMVTVSNEEISQNIFEQFEENTSELNILKEITEFTGTQSTGLLEESSSEHTLGAEERVTLVSEISVDLKTETVSEHELLDTEHEISHESFSTISGETLEKPEELEPEISSQTNKELILEEHQTEATESLTELLEISVTEESKKIEPLKEVPIEIVTEEITEGYTEPFETTESREEEIMEESTEQLEKTESEEITEVYSEGNTVESATHIILGHNENITASESELHELEKITEFGSTSGSQEEMSSEPSEEVAPESTTYPYSTVILTEEPSRPSRTFKSTNISNALKFSTTVMLLLSSVYGNHTTTGEKHKHTTLPSVYVDLPVFLPNASTPMAHRHTTVLPVTPLQEHFIKIMSSNATETLILFLSGPNSEAVKKLNGSKWVRRLGKSEATYQAQQAGTNQEQAVSQETVPLNKIPFPNYVSLDQCKKGDFEHNDKCFCAIDSLVTNLKQGVVAENTSAHLACLNFLKVNKGVVIGNESVAHVRKKRSYFFGKYDLPIKREVVDYSKGFFDEDFKIHNTDARIYALPGSKVVLPCVSRSEVVEYNRYMKYTWSFEDEIPITGNQSSS
jgi:hypothetical protein